MFFLDKDLKKPTKKPAATSSSNASSFSSFVSDAGIRSESSSADGKSGSDIVALARTEREQRAKLRELSVTVIKLQKWYRGRTMAKRILSIQRSSFDVQMEKILQISQVVEKASGKKFVPPPQTCIDMIKSACFQGYRTWQIRSTRLDYERIHALCSHALIPSLTQSSAAKNSSQLLASQPFLQIRLFSCLTAAMHRKGGSSLDTSEIVVSCLALLFGQPVSDDAAADRDVETETAFKSIRSHMMNRCAVFSSLRALLVQLAAPYMELCADDGESSKARKAVAAKKSIEPIVARVLSLVMFLIDTTAVVGAARGLGSSLRQHQFHAQSRHLESLCSEIFTCPLLTALMPPDSAFRLLQWARLNDLIDCIHVTAADSRALPSSPAEAFQSGHFLLGNIASLLPHVIAASASSDSSNLLVKLLRLGLSLARKFYLPGIFQGKAGILWSRSGSNITAAGVPSLLQHQVLGLLDSTLQQDLFLRALLPLREEVQSISIAADRQEVADSLSSSGLEMARSTLKEQLTESQSFFSGKWATRLLTSVGRSLGLAEGSTASTTTTTSVPAEEISALAINVVLPKSPYSLDPELLSAVCSLWSFLLPIAANRSSTKSESLPWKTLTSLAFSTRAVDRLWIAMLQKTDILSFATSFKPDRDLYPDGPFSILVAFCSVLRVYLQALDDAELYDQGWPLPLHQVVRVIRLVKVVLFKVLKAYPDALLEPPQPSAAAPLERDSSSGSKEGRSLSDRIFAYGAVKTFQVVLADLYTRWARRPFSKASTWEVDECGTATMRRELRDRTPLAAAVLHIMPWAIDFHERMRLFRETVECERVALQGTDDNRIRGVVIRVRKNNILEDGMKAMETVVGNSIKSRVQVRYVNAFGEEEAGIDIGGLFKDFVSDLSQRIFDPHYGLFSLTSSHFLYPNPSAVLLYGESELEALFIFLGRVLGKALFENITIQPQFAHFFLAFMHGRYNFSNLINDLSTLDPELFKNLMFLKNYQGDIADLCLSFSVSDDALGGSREVELFPGGSGVAVTSQNRHRYIHAMAKYYLHDRLKIQAGAFFHGLYQVISPTLLSTFCAPELQVLISGSVQGISLEDLKRNTRYSGGFLAMDRTVIHFWAVLEEMSEADRAKLVKFVTSCERPPSLGFAALQPPFTIQRVDGDDERLPTASTCFNVLKLPGYSSKAKLREKLLLSIRSGAGFDLS